MSKINSNIKTPKKRRPYMQILLVWVAFALMVLLSYFFMSNVVESHLDKESKDTLSHMEFRIDANLQELKTLLCLVSETVGGMIERGDDIEIIKNYISDTTNHILDEEHIPGFSAIFVMFDVFGGIGHNGTGIEEPEGYVPEDRPWFIAAEAAGGEIAVTAPYLDAYINEHIITFVRCLYDNNGKKIATIGVDVLITRLQGLTEDKHFDHESSYTILFDNELNIMIHPDSSVIGTNLRNLNSELAKFVEEMERGGSVSAYRIRNFNNESTVIYTRQIENGWHIGVVASVDKYYDSITAIRIFLITLGLLLAALVSMMFIRLDKNKAKAEEHTRILLDAMPYGANLWNRELKNIYTNEAAYKLFDLSSKNEYLEKFHELSPKFQPDGKLSAKASFDYVNNAFENGLCKFEWHHLKPNGAIMPAEVTLVRVAYQDDYIVAGYFRDLTETKTAIAEKEKALEEKQAMSHMQNILNGLDTMIYVSDPQTNEILFVNDALKKNFKNDGEYIGRRCYEVFIKGATGRCDFCPCHQLDKDPDKVVEWDIHLEVTGRDYVNNGRYIKWPDGRTVHLLSSIDITERKEAAKALDKQIKQQTMMRFVSQNFLSGDGIDNLINEAFRMIGEFMDVSHIIMYQLDEETSAYNCQYEWRDENLNLSSILGQSFPITSAQGLIDLIISLREKGLNYLTSDDPSIREAMIPYRVNSFAYMTTPVFIGDSLYAILDYSRENDAKPWAQGDIDIASFVANILTGVFHKHIAANELRIAKESAEQSNQTKSAFLASMSHEIRTPMNAILGMTEIQIQNQSLSPETEEAFSIIYDSSNLLMNLINDILDLSKIEAGKLEIISSKYDIPSLLNDTVQLNRLRFESKPLIFSLEVQENMPLELLGDELRIKQVLNNLLSNAFKYTDNGEIKLSVSAENVLEDDVNLILKVSDTGIGMTESELDKIFEEYARFNENANRTIVGAGLGMSITKRLVDEMSGDIIIESEVGKGSTFTVRLPQKRIGSAVCDAKLIKKLSELRFVRASANQKAQLIREYMPYGKVLIVDDVESNLFVAKGLLLPYGLNLETAISGFEAIEKIKSGKVYDLIYMDHMMPHMDGIETVKIMREMGYNEPIVALTANAISGQAKVFLKNGFDGFLAKPIDIRELNNSLNQMVRDKQPPEIIKAARKERNKNVGMAPAPQVALTKNVGKSSDNELIRFFVIDVEKGISVLEKKPDLKLYTTTVHGLKSVLANVGEIEMSNWARKLEQASRENDISLVEAETSSFIGALNELLITYKPSEEITNQKIMTTNDENFLREKLNVIKNACADFNKDSAKEALAELKEYSWPSELNSSLNDISNYLLHSKFNLINETCIELINLLE